MDRLPPYDLVAEQTVIACLLADPTPGILACEEAIEPVDFYDLRHRTVYQHMLEMRDGGKPLDLVSVTTSLRNSGTLEEVGGIGYLSSLEATSTAGLGYFFELILSKSRLRRLIQTCTDFAGRAYECNGESDELMAEFEAKALQIDRDGAAGRGMADVVKIVHSLTTDYEAAKDGSLPMGILTGYPDLDRMCGGMMPQELIFIAGLPSAGKTSLAVNIGHRVAESGIGVGIISLETSAKKMIHRMLSAMGRVSGARFMTGTADQGDFDKMGKAILRMNRAKDKIILSDDGRSSKSQVASTMRRMYQRGARLFIVDYLQCIKGSGISEYEQVTDASKALKRMGKELDCPIIVISSINREACKKEGAPRLSDLKGSGQLDFDADKALMLFSENTKSDPRVVQCHVVKNKDGEQGVVTLEFFASQFRFESASRVYEEPRTEKPVRKSGYKHTAPDA